MRLWLRFIYLGLALMPAWSVQAAVKGPAPKVLVTKSHSSLDAAPVDVAFDASYPSGMIVIRIRERRLYLVLGHGRARRYPVAVGKEGMVWTGEAYVKKKYVEPAWIAPLSLRNENPDLGHVIAGGAPNNPMGERALELNLSEIAIHGTAAFMRASIGTAASHGCIRMLNEHIIDLFDRVSVGTRVLAEP
jgi:lipoprotein-anchoring transpeptidase ErfK/SrfK